MLPKDSIFQPIYTNFCHLNQLITKIMQQNLPHDRKPDEDDDVAKETKDKLLMAKQKL